MRHIALMGRARSGKDTVAAHLVEHHGYKRVAFADPLKEMALKADPIVDAWVCRPPGRQPYADTQRLGNVVSPWGWEDAKDDYPEIRAFLQALGSAVRDVLGEDTWLRKGLDTQFRYRLAGYPTVFTDVRYLNEATALRNYGYTMVRIERPASQSGDTHPSETELDDYPADVTLANDGSVETLLRSVEGLL